MNMNLQIRNRYARGELKPTVRGLTAQKLVAARIGCTVNGSEQVSEFPGNVKVWWFLREQPDDLGRACALPWEKREEAYSCDVDLVMVGENEGEAIQKRESLSLSAVAWASAEQAARNLAMAALKQWQDSEKKRARKPRK